MFRFKKVNVMQIEIAAMEIEDWGSELECWARGRKGKHAGGLEVG